MPVLQRSRLGMVRCDITCTYRALIATRALGASPKSDAGIHEAATAMSGAAQVGECRARALESGALDSWLSRERLLCGADFRSLKFRSWPIGDGRSVQEVPKRFVGGFPAIPIRAPDRSSALCLKEIANSCRRSGLRVNGSSSSDRQTVQRPLR